MKSWVWLPLALLLSLLCAPLWAHEARPAYLELRQTAVDIYDVLWKVPAQGEQRRMLLDLRFAPDVVHLGSVRTAFARNAITQRWQVRRERGLDGTSIRIEGLEGTLTDVLVRLERLDGTTRTLRVAPASPSFVVEAQPADWEVARSYLALGVEHILLGVDHLLFVFALVLLVQGARRLLATITAFTAAHSLTLAAATLGWVHVATPPVEAMIALSIVFVAAEILQANARRTGLASRQPWIVAFLFGLLHGLGFAGALAEVGLPEQAIPIALLFFNVGVELGQLSFVAVVLGASFAARRVPWPRRAWLAPVPAYATGAIAAYWTIERVVEFWA